MKLFKRSSSTKEVETLELEVQSLKKQLDEVNSNFNALKNFVFKIQLENEKKLEEKVTDIYTREISICDSIVQIWDYLHDRSYKKETVEVSAQAVNKGKKEGMN